MGIALTVLLVRPEFVEGPYVQRVVSRPVEKIAPVMFLASDHMVQAMCIVTFKLLSIDASNPFQEEFFAFPDWSICN